MKIALNDRTKFIIKRNIFYVIIVTFPDLSCVKAHQAAALS